MYPSCIFPVDVQQFHQRLVNHNLIPQSRATQDISSLPSAPRYPPRCPICRSHLIKCHGCSIVTCDNGQCPCESDKTRCAGADPVPVMRCHKHDDSAYCLACFAEKHLIQCVFCMCWHCVYCMVTCIGQHDPSHELAQAHAPKIIACCTCLDEGDDIWDACSESACWSHSHVHVGVVCPDSVVSMGGHIACPCGETWVCGACAPKTILESGRRCPKCQTSYCFGCEYISACTDCRRATLCNGCIEEEMTDGEGSLPANKGANLKATCENCRRRICADCFRQHECCCESCNSVHCQDCVEHEKCSHCGALLCWTCVQDGCLN
ncbi:hypothetical protein EDB19DRAFT_347186 [Suillus lakei]|nr:hypothetical protein EDB19DRAFT_347186 [Suillus lakei]